MTEPVAGYSDGAALWRAATDRAKATVPAAQVSEVLRRLVFERFLARIFGDRSAPWVLKGGTAVLARVSDARHTKDVDLLGELDDLDVALARLRQACTLDLGDHFRFVITGHELQSGALHQPHVQGYRVTLEAYCGVKRRQRFGVDLVTGSLMTTTPDLAPLTSVLPLKGLAPAAVRLYPVVDHIADKLAATQATYGEGRLRSSRVRDLVDLVVFARTQTIDGNALITAIHAEWTHRNLPAGPTFAPPPEWARTYRSVAARTPHTDGVRSFTQATDLITAFLGPAMDRSAAGQQWTPEPSAWT